MTVELAKQRQVVIDLKTGRPRPMMAQAPILSSARAMWDGVLLEQHAGLAVEAQDVAIPHHALFLQLRGTSLYEAEIGDMPRHSLEIRPGLVGILPAMTPVSARSLNSGEFLCVTLEPKFLLCLAHEMLAPNGLELKVRTAHEDPMLQACLLALQREAQSGGPGGRLYAESVATAIAAHLVRHHSTQTEKNERSAGRGKLTRGLLNSALDFLQRHLAEDISLRMLAEAVGLSPYYFSRLFKESTGCTPHQYLIQCRVQRAKDLLLRSELSISEAALQVGFCDQSHFSGHFKRLYGLTPRAFIRRSGKRALLA